MSAHPADVERVEPLAILVGALGGEGGGVLTDWLVAAASAQGYPVQSTSIPGVAQRTGATFYYTEIFPLPRQALGGREPVLALYPAPGRVDIVVASELVEAGRALEIGMVSPERTVLIASTHRIYSVLEKSSLGDGRLDSERILKAAPQMAKRAILADLSQIAREADSVLNAVLLGAIAGCGALEVPVAAFEQAIRDGGVAVESNLRGFAAGLALAQGESAAAQPEPAPAAAPRPLPAALEARLARDFPAAAHAVLRAGWARLVDFQGPAYADAYLTRLAPILAADRASGGQGRGFALTRETARWLALWMSYEDAIRVAQQKTLAARIARVRAETGALPHEPVHIVEFLDPGLEEICAILPRPLARPLLALAARWPWLERKRSPMSVRTDTVLGFGQLWLMARLRPLRPWSHRYREENLLAGDWLALVERLAGADPALALEAAQLARLIKGYGDTYRRGRQNYAAIAGALAPANGRGLPDAAWLRQAREAALADPEGQNLEIVLARRGTGGTAPAAH
jgi:indolepyruvate ferredoxin oxidoreductase beta subunit